MNGLTRIFLRFVSLLLGLESTENFPPPLSAQEEKELFKKMHSGDMKARGKLIEHNLRLVSHIIRKYYSSYGAQDELLSIGSLGLIKAIDSFKFEVGTRFATYGAKCIQNEILMHFRSQKKLSCEVSLNDTIDVDRDGNPLTYIDVISCDESLTGDVETKINTDKALRLLRTELTPRERKIICLRYGIGGREPMTQKQIAEMLKISRSYVSRIEKTALDKLRSHF